MKGGVALALSHTDFQKEIEEIKDLQEYIL